MSNLFLFFKPPPTKTHLILNQNEHISDAIIWHHDWIKTNPFLEVLCRDCDFFKICTCSGYVNTKKIIKMEKITCFVVVLLLFGLFGSRIRESSSLSFNFSVIQVLKSSRVAYTTATESLFLCRCPIDKTWIFTPTDRVRSFFAAWSKFLLKSWLGSCLLRSRRNR